MLRILAFCLSLCFVEAVLAQSNDLAKMSQEAFDSASEAFPALSAPLVIDPVAEEEALKKSRQVMEGLGSRKLVTPAIPDLLNIPSPPVDIGRLSQQGQNLMGRIDERSSEYASQVLVFVSSSLPDKTIKHYLQQTQRIDAAIVLRGLIGDSMSETQVYLGKLLESFKDTDFNPTILIDPTLFERFGIHQVPTTVVTESQIQPCQTSDCPTPVYHSVSGDVSLSWALGLVSRQIDSDDLKQTLRPLIKDLEKM